MLSANRSWNLTTTGLTPGDSCEFFNGSNFSVLLKVGGVTVYTLPVGSYLSRVTLVWDGSAFFAG